MDNIKRALPIRNYQLTSPLVVAFNIHLTHYNAYGLGHYQRLINTLTNKRGANMNKNTVYLLPNITNLDTSIEIRAQSLARSVKALMRDIGS
jgi:hypothetical protein